jgi:hypothetical protein
LIRVQSKYTMTPMHNMYEDRHMKKFKRVMRHMKLIGMNRRLFWMHVEMSEIDQGAVHVHYDPHVPHVQGQDMEKFKRVMRHIKLISMNRRLFLMH